MIGRGARNGRFGMEEHAEFRSLVATVQGLAVRALVSSGPTSLARAHPVVLVHGLGLSHRYMMPVAEALAASGRRVYVPDLPGFGDSGHPDRVLDIPGLADALAAWMASVGVDRAALVGNSQGCQIIADLAARHPERVECAVLQGPTTPPGERTWLQQFIRWRQNAPYNPPELDPVTYPEYRRCGYGRLWQTFRHSLKDRIEDKLPRMAAPVLVVRGQHDPICRGPWAAKMARLLPDGRLVEIPGVAHTLCFTSPVELAGVTKTFLDEAMPPAEERHGV